jgi:hypothetical protein
MTSPKLTTSKAAAFAAFGTEAGFDMRACIARQQAEKQQQNALIQLETRGSRM